MNLLSPLGWLYGRIMDLRNTLYDRSILKSHALGATTISVGNLTAGGTGKTPITALIAHVLIGQGEKVAILTRGYGRRDPKTRVVVSDGKEILADAVSGGDEPVELARRLNAKVVVVADADRAAAAEWARQRYEISAFILDDGFQHRHVKRDLDIVCIDATDPISNGNVLPAGKLREPIIGLERADVIVITRADLVENSERVAEFLRKLNKRARIFMSSNKLVRFVDLDEFLYENVESNDSRSIGVVTDEIRNFANSDGVVRLAAFCGLGNPEAFFLQITSLADCGNRFDLVQTKSFRDHHIYRQQDIDDLINSGKGLSIDAFLTTAKDAVKLSGLSFRKPCFVAIAETAIDDMDAFRDLIGGRFTENEV